MTGTVVATYDLASYIDLEKAAQVVAGEQSSGTFIAVPGETPELRARHGARVLDITPAAPPAGTPLPGAMRPPGGGELRAGRVRIAFPLENFGTSVPNLLCAVAGNLFELRELAACKLIDLELPEAFATAYPGPAFGSAGTRKLMGIGGGAIVGTIVKPSVGLTGEPFRALIRELVEAGIDFIKDDELMGDPPYFPVVERVRIVSEEVERGAQRTGKRTMYACNITGEYDAMQRNLEALHAAGATCAMLVVNAAGFPGLTMLRRRAGIPIHAHRAMGGAFARDPALGIGYLAWQKLVRLCGGDHIHVSGMQNKFYESDDDVATHARALMEPLFGGYAAIPVLSSAQWAGTAPVTYERLGTDDLMVLAGGGITAHPGGPAAGVASIRAAWDATVHGEDLATRAAREPALRDAIAHFGTRS